MEAASWAAGSDQRTSPEGDMVPEMVPAGTRPPTLPLAMVSLNPPLLDLQLALVCVTLQTPSNCCTCAEAATRKERPGFPR
jgi:hypothetical protein